MFDVNLAILSLIQDDESSIPFIILTIVIFAYVFYAKNKEFIKEVAQLDPSTKMSVRMFRFLHKHSIKIIYIFFISFFVYLKYDNLIPVTASMSDLKGIKQRIAIYDKLYEYKRSVPDYLDDPGRHRGGFFNYLFEWDKKPTYSEAVYLKEYLTKVFTCYDELLKSNKICRKKYSGSLLTDRNLKEALDIMYPVNHMIKLIGKDPNKKLSEFDEVDYLIPWTLKQYFGCPENNKIVNKKDVKLTRENNS